MYILFEGLDLSGKSTLCRALAAELGWPIRNNTILPAGRSPIYDEGQSERRGQRERETDPDDEPRIGRLFLNALKHEIENYAAEGEPCIQDSSIILRSIAYHTGLGNAELAEEFTKLLPHHPKPALAFLCTASREKRLKRLDGRISRGNDMEEDYAIRDNIEMFEKMEEKLLQVSKEFFHITVIDTGELEDTVKKKALVDQLVEKIQSVVNQ